MFSSIFHTNTLWPTHTHIFFKAFVAQQAEFLQHIGSNFLPNTGTGALVASPVTFPSYPHFISPSLRLGCTRKDSILNPIQSWFNLTQCCTKAYKWRNIKFKSFVKTLFRLNLILLQQNFQLKFKQIQY